MQALLAQGLALDSSLRWNDRGRNDKSLYLIAVVINVSSIGDFLP
jgi:hypothetical protein